MDDEKLKVYRESYSVKDCVDALLKRLKTSGRVSLFATFREVEQITREYVITTFLAVLELSNKHGIRIFQDDTYSDIIILS